MPGRCTILDGMRDTYHVQWVIEIDADTAADAAVQALGIQRDPYSLATVFQVSGGDLVVTETWDVEDPTDPIQLGR